MANDMNLDEKYRLEKEMRDKEFVYDQWRKLLCIFVVNDDISVGGSDPREKATAEQIRTVFNHGYKLALLQTRESIVDELRKYLSGNDSLNAILNGLINEIDSRIYVSSCYELLKDKFDTSMLIDAKKRDYEFNKNYSSDSFSTWCDKKM